MSLRLKLKTKFILFFIAYSIFLLASVLGYFFISNQRTIKRQAAFEVTSFTMLFAESLTKELQNSITELIGLKSRFALYRLPSGGNPHFAAADLAPVEQFVVAYPFKYAEIVLGSQPNQEALSISPARTLTEEIKPLVQRKNVADFVSLFSGKLDQNLSMAVQVVGPEYISGRDLVHLRLPIQPDYSTFLYAAVRLDYLIERVLVGLNLPTEYKLAVADSNGIILYARDVQMLQAYLNVYLPKFEYSADDYHHLTEGLKTQSTLITRWQSLNQPRVILVLQKDIAAELAEWRSKTLKVLLFVCFIFLSALIFIWVLVGRIESSLQNVTAVANRVATGDFSQKIIVERQDELGVLIRAFNEMIDKLQVSYKTLNAINSQLAEKIIELKHTRQELSQKQRLALLGEAISKISHEVQNKIGGVSIWVQNLERHSTSDDTSQLYVQELKRALKTSLDMLVNFKRFYREPLLQRRPVLVTELIAAGLTQLSAALAAKQITIEKNICADSDQIWADQEQMTDALVNLLLNAIYFSPEKGTIKITVERLPQNLVISIMDQGPGIPAKDKDKLLLPFFTTKPGGSGLGLAIVNNIVKAHHGKLRASNMKRDWGACFEITLPTAETETKESN